MMVPESRQQHQAADLAHDSISHTVRAVEEDSDETAPFMFPTVRQSTGVSRGIRDRWQYRSLGGNVSVLNSDSDESTQIQCLLCRTVVCLLRCLVIMALAVSMVTMGVLYGDDCPARDDLGLYLLAMGICLIVRLALFCWGHCLHTCCSNSHARTGRVERVLDRASQVLEATLLVLLIVESIKVYSVYGSVLYDKGRSVTTYCQPALFKFTLFSLTAIYIVLLSAIALVAVGAHCRIRQCCGCFCCCNDCMHVANDEGVITV